MAIKLPALGKDAAWDTTPPDPLDRPELYDSVIMRRITGFVVDVILIGILYWVLFFALGLLAVFSFGLLSPLLLLLPILGVLYHSYFIGSAGATPGMKLMDLEVRSWTGKPVDFAQAFIMTAIFYVTMPPTGGLILLVALFTESSPVASIMRLLTGLACKAVVFLRTNPPLCTWPRVALA